MQPEEDSEGLRGEGALNNIRGWEARELIVQVEDENHKPIAGVTVEFHIQDGLSGAGARFGAWQVGWDAFWASPWKWLLSILPGEALFLRFGAVMDWWKKRKKPVGPPSTPNTDH